ncbi:MAG: carbamoyltransferase [Candidatus Tectomicrobia bacterium]|nr:carbamoyltransferase [Candidatus Tectomicrobia bacterium]
MIILGINAYHGDASAVLLRDGQVVAALEEERFRRIKHCAGFPREAVRRCLEMGGVTPGEVDCFALSRNPRAHLLRKVLFALRRGPGWRLVSDRLRNAGRVVRVVRDIAESLGVGEHWVSGRMHRVEHHPAHLASAFFVSPFEEAAVCSVDGFGDFVSTSWGVGRGSRLKVLGNVYFPHSLGLLYLAITQYLGFPRYGDEFKVMGLAPYGAPECVEAIRRLVRLTPRGGFELDLSYFRHWSEGVAMTWEDGEPVVETVYTPKIEALLGPARNPKDPLGSRHEAIAASLQEVFEEAAYHVLNGLYEKTRLPRLCLAGGCAMNSVANGKIRQRTPFEEVYIQPGAADNGTALGAAYYVYHQVLGHPRTFVMDHAYWGPAFDPAEIWRTLSHLEVELNGGGCNIRSLGDEESLCRYTAERIAEGKVVGWFQGRMEWAARALGNRSILADPRRSDMRDIINTKIKFRERFRPFAPAVLEESVDEYFVGGVPDPFMIQVYPVRPDKRDVIPAVTHVDGSGRLQTVSRETNPVFWRLIREFQRLTGVPVLLNTSFNENEPIVCTPREALDCFLRTRMDLLILGNLAIEK